MSSSFPTSIRAFTRLCDVLPLYGLKVSVTGDLSPQVCAKFSTLGLLLGSSFLLDRIPGNSHVNEIEMPVHLVMRKTSEQRATISLAMGIEMFQRIFTQWFSRTTTHHHINPSTELYLPVHFRHPTSFLQCQCGCITLSCMEVAALAGSPSITPQNLTITQQEDDIVDVTGPASLDLQHVSITTTDATLLCDITTGILTKLLSNVRRPHRVIHIKAMDASLESALQV